MKATITDRAIKALKPGAHISDDMLGGFVVRRLPSGRVTFAYTYTAKNGKRPWLALGLHGAITVTEARDLAKGYAGDVARGLDPAKDQRVEAARSENTINFILDEWLKHARSTKATKRGDPLRSADKIEKIFARHVRPAIGKHVVYDLVREDVVAMLRKIAPVAADRVLAHLSSALNWWRVGDSKFVTMPIVKGMKRGSVSRERVLSTVEIADLWKALDETKGVPEFFPALVRTILLLGCRRDEIGKMHTDEIDGADFTIPAARYKTARSHLLPLPPQVLAMLPIYPKSGYIFSENGKRPFSVYSRSKLALDDAIAALRRREGRKPMPAWQLRDLRRTCRTMMVSIGIADDIAAKVNGQVLGGIAGTYNVYSYRDEKAAALVRFADHIAGIVGDPAPAGNVVPLPAPAARRRAGIG